MTAKPEINKSSTAVTKPDVGEADLLEQKRGGRPLTALQKTAVTYVEQGTLTWAQGLKARTAYAIALWCLGRDIDPHTEMDILGNRPWPNGRFWKRKLAELIAEKDSPIEDYAETPIHHDARLEQGIDAEWEAAEVIRRRRLRIEFGCPEEAKGAWVVSIKVRGVETPFRGCEWAGGGTAVKVGGGGVVKRGAEADPVGENFPIESALTRAYKRVVPLVARYSPRLRELIERAEDTSELEPRITEDRKEDTELRRETALVGTHPLATDGKTDPYAEPGPPSAA